MSAKVERQEHKSPPSAASQTDINSTTAAMLSALSTPYAGGLQLGISEFAVERLRDVVQLKPLPQAARIAQESASQDHDPVVTRLERHAILSDEDRKATVAFPTHHAHLKPGTAASIADLARKA